MIPIIIPFTNLEEETRLVGEQVGAAFVQLNPKDDEDYFNLICEYWDRREGVIIIEHDMVPTVEQVMAMVDCPEPWCAWPYEYLGTDKEGTGRVVYPGGGCCKYGAELMKYPEIMARAGARFDDHPPKHWCRLDENVMWEVQAFGFTRHVHEGVVRHLHPNVSHNCVIVNEDMSFTRILKPYLQPPPPPTPPDPRQSESTGQRDYH